MTQIHIITPFMRANLKETLIEAYRPMNIIWHPIMFFDEMVDFDHQGQNQWIFPLVIPGEAASCKVKMPGCYKRNLFIKNIPIIDDDYYVTADDDDMYESGVFDAIKKMNDDIVIISMKRGDCIPDDVTPIRRYPTSTLIAKPENIQIGRISAQQSFVKGRIFKQHLFNEDSHCWDGEIAIHHKDSGEHVGYRPELFALFNFYEPGRWNNVENPGIAFGLLVNDMMRLDMVFRQSELDPNIQCHTIKLPETATNGLNKLLEIIEAEGHDVAVLSHQDMFYRSGWIEQMKSKIAELPDSWVVAGIIGKDMEGAICGKLHDMRIPLHFHTGHNFPVEASCFDECCIIVNLKHRFRFDEGLKGFDLYGTLCVLQAQEMGLTAWIIDAFCEHYCMRPFSWYPDKNFEACFKWVYGRFPNARRIDTTVMGVPRKQQ